MKILIFSLLLVSLLLSFSCLTDAIPSVPAPTPGASSCDVMCNARCGKAGIYKRCFRYCSICCDKCKCVPSGKYGNKSECPCYRDMVNSKGQPKCP